MSEFFKTRMGQKFYEHDVPTIAKSLVRIADALEQLARSDRFRWVDGDVEIERHGDMTKAGK